MSWALTTQSAIDGPRNGILAASEDICAHIDERGSCDALHIFEYPAPAGLYLWTGTMTKALEGEAGHRE